MIRIIIISVTNQIGINFTWEINNGLILLLFLILDFLIFQFFISINEFFWFRQYFIIKVFNSFFWKISRNRLFKFGFRNWNIRRWWCIFKKLFRRLSNFLFFLSIIFFTFIIIKFFIIFILIKFFNLICFYFILFLIDTSIFYKYFRLILELVNWNLLFFIYWKWDILTYTVLLLCINRRLLLKSFMI